MPRITIWYVAMFIILLSLTACKPGGPNIVIVTERDVNSKLELNKGDILEVTLVGNPSTGFMWEPKSLDTTIIRQKGEWEFKADNSTPGFVGSPGKITIRLEAVGSGQTTLQLIYHRPFEPDTPPAQTFEMIVVVK